MPRRSPSPPYDDNDSRRYEDRRDSHYGDGQSNCAASVQSVSTSVNAGPLVPAYTRYRVGNRRSYSARYEGSATGTALSHNNASRALILRPDTPPLSYPEQRSPVSSSSASGHDGFPLRHVPSVRSRHHRLPPIPSQTSRSAPENRTPAYQSSYDRLSQLEEEVWNSVEESRAFRLDRGIGGDLPSGADGHVDRDTWINTRVAFDRE
ncbi:hypothetical protein CI109_106826 [Kwoniella shandongensis]|uniref:Uncharacterized protein n=1 Tax=Kwoniella shandongensis TaxID=1734106 RepID=A0AAJ8LSA5_9TREE